MCVGVWVCLLVCLRGKGMSYVFPMSYYMAGLFRNEFQDNGTALGSVSYASLADMFDYHSSLVEAMLGLLVVGLVFRLLWLLLLRAWETMRRREMLRKVGAAKKRVSRLITAGLRWRQRYSRRSTRYMSMEEEILAEIDSGTASAPASFSESGKERRGSRSFMRSSQQRNNNNQHQHQPTAAGAASAPSSSSSSSSFSGMWKRQSSRDASAGTGGSLASSFNPFQSFSSVRDSAAHDDMETL